MKMKKVLSVVLLSSLVLGACGGEEEPKEEEAKTEETKTEETATTEGSGEAEELYSNKSCVGCHGQDLEGASGPELAKVGAKLSKDEIKDVLLNGKGSMPSGLVSDEEAETLATWLAEKK